MQHDNAFPAGTPALGGRDELGSAGAQSASVDKEQQINRGRVALLLFACAGGAGAASRSTPRKGVRNVAQRALPNIDWLGQSTGWGDIEEKSIFSVNWRNEHGVLAITSILLFIYQLVRIAILRQPPSFPEVWMTTAIYVPWIFLCWRDTCKLEAHYRVTFYASCGWAVMSLASLHASMLQAKSPALAFDILAAGNVVFAVACIYFYSYHWSRMWRHFVQGRFRPLWIPGLMGLMCLHALTPADFYKRLDDEGWWKTVCQIYTDEWWWVADVRIIELFVTAAALWLIVLHIQGVFTGMKNAALVVIGTIFAPLIIMVLESTWLRASSWQHYFMVGPKYWGM